MAKGIVTLYRGGPTKTGLVITGISIAASFEGKSWIVVHFRDPRSPNRQVMSLHSGVGGKPATNPVARYPETPVHLITYD